VPTSPPLVAHIIFRLDYGGLENGLVNILNGMPAEQFRHAIICLAGYSDFHKRLKRDDVMLYSLEKRPGKDFGAYLRLWRLLRRLKPAIVHTRNLGTVDLQWIALASGVGGRVHGEHGWDAADPQGKNRGNLRIRRACRAVIHRYVAMSRDLENWLRSQVGVTASRITQIYNGVDIQRFAPTGPLPADLPWQSANEKPFVFGTVGRLDRVKNQIALVESFAELTAAHQAGRERLLLMLVGSGPMEEALRDRVRALGIGDRVWFTGARNDIPHLMRSMDVFVLPSLNEGISNTILEAMASGLPVIAAQVGGNPELVQSAATGTLYESERPGRLRDAMANYLANPILAKEQGAAARAHVVKGFSLDSMVNAYLRLYRDLLV